MDKKRKITREIKKHQKNELKKKNEIEKKRLQKEFLQKKISNSDEDINTSSKYIHLDRSSLNQNGRFILVEYNVDRGNHWVPYPLSFTSWRQLAQKSGFKQTELLATYPSRFLHEIYAAVSRM